jgi:peptide/nickel transport system substrate-binding protein
MARDALGQALAASLDEMTGSDGNALTIRLKEPFPLLLEGLAKVSSLVPFMMPERTAKTDPYQRITDTIGSGPFKFVNEDFEPGHNAVYVTGSSGSSLPSPRLRRLRWSMARSIGGRTRRLT